MSEVVKVPIGPFSGLDLRRIDDRSIQGAAMRGGYNVAVVDGEWWTRGGTVGNQQPTREVVWRHIWVDPQSSAVYWISPYCIVKFVEGVGFSFPYTRGVTDDITLIQGQKRATAAGARTAGDMFAIGGTVYFVTNVAGADLTLDKACTSNGLNLGVQIITPPTGVTASSGTGVTRSAYTIFWQQVAYSAGVYFAAAPATARARYLVHTWEGMDPVAINLDSVSAMLTNFASRTSRAAGSVTSLGTASYCVTYKDRLFLGRLNDASGANPTRTIWYSAPADFLLWYDNGRQGIDADDNFISFVDGEDTISGMNVVRDRLIVHKAKSQIIYTASGNEEITGTAVRNNQGLGVRELTADASVLVDGNNYFWSSAGPAVFDGQAVTLLRTDLYAIPQALNAVPASNRVLAMVDEDLGIITWFINSASSLPPELEEDHGVALCFDYRRNQWWVYDLPNAGGGDAKVTGCGFGYFAIGGEGFKLPHWGGSAKDSYVNGTPPYEARIRSKVATPWMTLGSEDQKAIHGFDFYVRAITDSYSVGGASIRPAYTDADLAGQTLGFRCEVYSDMDVDAPAQTLDVTYSEEDAAFTAAAAEYGLEPRLRIEVPAHVTGRLFRFVFDNEPVGGETETRKRTPFRISQVIARMRGGESQKTER